MPPCYAYNFVETPPAKYCCGVCSLPLREAHQTGCGHRLCRSCADGLLTCVVFVFQCVPVRVLCTSCHPL
uniref:RING-type domain-containing protein n=1 Tax=Eptatretus burgeri TaxID=7764 RepID=A0A8C4ND53_EPTBU